MAIFKGETKLLPRLHLLIIEHKYSTFHVRQLNAPAHWEEILLKIGIIELDIDPLHQILTVLDIVKFDLNFDHP